MNLILTIFLAFIIIRMFLKASLYIAFVLWAKLKKKQDTYTTNVVYE